MIYISLVSSENSIHDNKYITICIICIPINNFFYQNAPSPDHHPAPAPGQSSTTNVGSSSTNVCPMAVIHCSALVGRTGTLIGLDTIAKEVDAGRDSVDIFNTVYRMREDRERMVKLIMYEYRDGGFFHIFFYILGSKACAI